MTYRVWIGIEPIFAKILRGFVVLFGNGDVIGREKNMYVLPENDLKMETPFLFSKLWN